MRLKSHFYATKMSPEKSKEMGATRISNTNVTQPSINHCLLPASTLLVKTHSFGPQDGDKPRFNYGSHLRQQGMHARGQGAANNAADSAARHAHSGHLCLHLNTCNLYRQRQHAPPTTYLAHERARTQRIAREHAHARSAQAHGSANSAVDGRSQGAHGGGQCAVRPTHTRADSVLTRAVDGAWPGRVHARSPHVLRTAQRTGRDQGAHARWMGHSQGACACTRRTDPRTRWTAHGQARGGQRTARVRAHTHSRQRRASAMSAHGLTHTADSAANRPMHTVDNARPGARRTAHGQSARARGGQAHAHSRQRTASVRTSTHGLTRTAGSVVDGARPACARTRRTGAHIRRTAHGQARARPERACTRRTGARTQWTVHGPGHVRLAARWTGHGQLAHARGGQAHAHGGQRTGQGAHGGQRGGRGTARARTRHAGPRTRWTAHGQARGRRGAARAVPGDSETVQMGT
ncbi:hypothetical protein GGX14DRAFT_392611 [Mycena pura]|uniref:Uncharacterized protein n=1 Tax=Mycena pura TaxID=153505 RepID=A0AAD6YHE2_9AGAR|nr:hypothetical protein GGX14DRAFT_392611 [Mycena pura]